MKILSYEELSIFIKQELAIPNNPRIVTCYSKNNDRTLHQFIIAKDDVCIQRPWQGYPEKISKGGYIHADITDIYGIQPQTFKECFTLATPI